MACFLSNEYRLAQRSAWSVSHAARLKPAMILPYIKDLTAQLLRNDVHDAVIRNSTRILNEIKLPEKYHGEVMNACFLLAEKAETPIAIRAFSLSMLHKLSRLYPDIRQELNLIAGSHLNNDSIAIRSVAKKIVNSTSV